MTSPMNSPTTSPLPTYDAVQRDTVRRLRDFDAPSTEAVIRERLEQVDRLREQRIVLDRRGT